MSSIFFETPLRMQRQRWILGCIRDNIHDTVLELGCNEGPITRALIKPALWIEPSEEWKENFKSAFNVADHPFIQLPSIAPKKIICVDKDEKTVSKLGVHIDEKAKKELQQNILRFSHLTVELNATDYRNINSFKKEIDVLIASEFIEHLDDDCLNEFGPRVLGNWKPKIVLITTPNYSFNVKFKNDSHSQKSYKDPTGRTDRMFRHDDHKFEWTIVEFRSWIEKIAEVYGYHAKFDEIGRGYRLVDDVKEEDLTDAENARCASHCCILTRILPKEQIATSNDVEENEKSYKNVHEFIASDKQLCEDGDLNIFESTFDHLAFETEQGLMANMYEIWLDEEIRKAYCGNLETFLPDAKSLQNQEYSLVEKDGDIFILKKLL